MNTRNWQDKHEQCRTNAPSEAVVVIPLTELGWHKKVRRPESVRIGRCGKARGNVSALTGADGMVALAAVRRRAAPVAARGAAVASHRVPREPGGAGNRGARQGVVSLAAGGSKDALG